MNKKLMLIIIPIVVVVVIALIILVSVISGYNSMVDMRETIDASSSQIEVRLQQRHDKMIQMTAAVEGLEEHAQQIYTIIATARTQYDNASTMDELIEADAAEADALSRLLVVVEDNPDVSATGLYYTYVDEIAATEATLAVARRDYNNSVQEYNTEVKKFPKVMYANMFSFEKTMPYWKMNDGADEIPTVDFTD